MQNKYYIKYGYFGHKGKRYINLFQAIGYFILGALVRTELPDGAIIFWSKNILKRTKKQAGEFDRR